MSQPSFTQVAQGNRVPVSSRAMERCNLALELAALGSRRTSYHRGVVVAPPELGWARQSCATNGRVRHIEPGN